MEMEEPIPVSRHGRVAGVPYHVFDYHGVSFAVHARRDRRPGGRRLLRAL